MLGLTLLVTTLLSCYQGATSAFRRNMLIMRSLYTFAGLVALGAILSFIRHWAETHYDPNKWVSTIFFACTTLAILMLSVQMSATIWVVYLNKRPVREFSAINWLVLGSPWILCATLLIITTTAFVTQVALIPPAVTQVARKCPKVVIIDINLILDANNNLSQNTRLMVINFLTGLKQNDIRVYIINDSSFRQPALDRVLGEMRLKTLVDDLVQWHMPPSEPPPKGWIFHNPLETDTELKSMYRTRHSLVDLRSDFRGEPQMVDFINVTVFKDIARKQGIKDWGQVYLFFTDKRKNTVALARHVGFENGFSWPRYSVKNNIKFIRDILELPTLRCPRTSL